MDTDYSYPRPQMKREHYLLLHGEWKLNNNIINVPFPPQSAASGYVGEVNDTLLYEKRFSVPPEFTLPRFLLHFGAVDQVAEVWLNGHFLGGHKGGYLPFSFDVTGILLTGAENVLKVKATDTLSVDLPYGKQRKKRGGMWYTPVSGIWGCVWLENVPLSYIRRLSITPDLTGLDVEVELSEGGEVGFSAEIWIDPQKKHSLKVKFNENKARINFIDLIAGSFHEDFKSTDALFWTPENPRLFPMEIRTKEDRVETYFALRTIEICPVDGVERVCLNGKPIFLHGLLDQGYFPDGIYRPTDLREYERDVLRAKDLGFNCIRKHIKIEPEQFYYACDLHGILVIQDMVNSGVYSFFCDTFLPNFIFWMKSDKKHPELDLHRKKFFIEHMLETMEVLHNHPSIIAYTIFNEGWGQFDSDRLYGIAKEKDPTRLIDSTSGWFAQKLSDFDSKHIYFHIVRLKPRKRPLLLSECGGYSMEVEGHLFKHSKGHFGYGRCHDRDELTDAMMHLYDQMVLPAIRNGLCGCIYTQLTDVEEEVNGIYTYDRKVLKPDRGRLRALARRIGHAMENC
ncbi:MAG: hypothetical protein IJT05_06805 [Lachnospiraceae bacterium]|nr:hypothetical protein [Lachnospiraceae bacterium]